MSCVSAIAAGITTAGFQFAVGTGGSPETFVVVANGHNITINDISDVQDITNFCDTYHRRIPTLNDFGPVAFMIYWVFEEPTHRNSPAGGGVAAGLRYLKEHQTLADFQLQYQPGVADAISGYVTKFNVTGSIGKVWEAAIEIVNAGTTPSLV